MSLKETLYGDQELPKKEKVEVQLISPKELKRRKLQKVFKAIGTPIQYIGIALGVVLFAMIPLIPIGFCCMLAEGFNDDYDMKGAARIPMTALALLVGITEQVLLFYFVYGKMLAHK